MTGDDLTEEQATHIVETIIANPTRYPPGPCTYCGTEGELRPYGKDGAMICRPCGIKPENIDIARQRMHANLTGEPLKS